MTVLRGIAWDNPRGIAPMLATAAAFARRRPDVRIEWESRSIEEFAYAALPEIAGRFDLLLIDHPHLGADAISGSLLPLDEFLTRSYLDDQERNSVGPSYRSYSCDGRQWALAVDAAAQVAAFRSDLIDELGIPLPRSWADVVSLAENLSEGVRLAVPLAPIDAACCLLSIGVNLYGEGFWRGPQGYEPSALEEAIALLRLLSELSDPRSIDLNPPRVLDLMAAEDTIAYVPLVFGYSNYARTEAAGRVVSFTDMPSHSPEPTGSVLGGVGLAVSAHTSAPADAAEYAAFVASPDIQRGLYFSSGGQPGHRAAWIDPTVDRAASGFFSSTIATLDHAFLRPRLAEEPGFNVLQAKIGKILHQQLAQRATVSETAAEVARVATSSANA